MQREEVGVVLGATCWDGTFTPNLCCVSRGVPFEKNPYGCWDSKHTYDYCCGHVPMPEAGQRVWADPGKWHAFSETEDTSWAECAEFLGAFDWQKTDQTVHEARARGRSVKRGRGSTVQVPRHPPWPRARKRTQKHKKLISTRGK